MIKAYVVGISTHHEGDEIEVRYSIYKEGELLAQEKKYLDYKKPFLVNHFALMTLMRALKKMPNEETEIIMYDSALNELLKGTSTTQNNEALKTAARVNSDLKKFTYPVKIIDVTGNNKELLAWNKAVEF